MPRHYKTARWDNNQTTKHMDGLIIAIIALTAVSAASIAINAWQYKEREHCQTETNQFIKDAAKLELELASVKDELDNERKHHEWAIGRIKDQGILVTGLRNALKAASKDRWKQWQEKQREEDNGDV